MKRNETDRESGVKNLHICHLSFRFSGFFTYSRKSNVQRKPQEICDFHGMLSLIRIKTLSSKIEKSKWNFANY